MGNSESPGLKFSSEIEVFKRATHHSPIFLWGSLKVGIEIFNRDWTFQAGLKISIPDLSGVLRANLKGAEKKRTLQKHPFGQPFLRTTPSPLLWRALKSLRAQRLKTKYQDLEIFKRDWKSQARRPPDPYFLWGILKVRAWIFQARLKIQSRLIFFSIFGPLVSLVEGQRCRNTQDHVGILQRTRPYQKYYATVPLGPLGSHKQFPENFLVWKRWNLLRQQILWEYFGVIGGVLLPKRDNTRRCNFFRRLRLSNPQKLFGVIGGAILTLINSRKNKMVRCNPRSSNGIPQEFFKVIFRR